MDLECIKKIKNRLIYWSDVIIPFKISTKLNVKNLYNIFVLLFFIFLLLLWINRNSSFQNLSGIILAFSGLFAATFALISLKDKADRDSLYDIKKEICILYGTSVFLNYNIDKMNYYKKLISKDHIPYHLLAEYDKIFSEIQTKVKDKDFLILIDNKLYNKCARTYDNMILIQTYNHYMMKSIEENKWHFASKNYYKENPQILEETKDILLCLKKGIDNIYQEKTRSLQKIAKTNPHFWSETEDKD